LRRHYARSRALGRVPNGCRSYGAASPVRLDSVSSAVWLVVGVQAAGKSTVAELLVSTFTRGVHVHGSQFYRWAVRGWTHPGDEQQPDEARRLLVLRYKLSALVADQYCAAQFDTVVQDNIFGRDVIDWLDSVRARPRHLVVLRPSREAVEQRERERTLSTGKIAYRPGSFTINELDAALASIPGVGLWLDTSHQTPSETVTEILDRRSEAIVDEALPGSA